MRLKITVLAILVLILWPFQYASGGSRALAQTGSWTTLAPLPIAKTAMAVTTGADGRIYVFGGTDNATQDYADSEVYDPTRNAWTPLAPLPVPESYASATLGADGKIYIFGGFNSRGNQSLNNVFAYDPTTNSYACSGNFSGCASSNLAPMPTPRSVMAITVTADGTIWTIGGFTNVPVATVEMYNPASNSWSSGPPLPNPESGASATEFPFGYIDVIGGFDGQTYNSADFLLPLPPPGSSNPLRAAMHPTQSSRPAATWKALSSAQTGLQPDSRLLAPAPWWCKYPTPHQQQNELLWIVRHHSFFDLERVIGKDFAQYVTYYLYLKDEHFFDADPQEKAKEQMEFDKYIMNACSGSSSLFHSARRASLLAGLHPARALGQTPNSVQLPSLVSAGGGGPGGVGANVTIYDWWNDVFSVGPSLPGPREAAGSSMDFNGRVYVIGGDDGASVYNTVFAYSAPLITIDLNTVLPPTATPLPAPTNTPVPATATSPPAATSTPVPPTAPPLPTATSTSVPAAPTSLSLRVSLLHTSVKPGRKQTVTAHTASGATVTFALLYPNGARKHHTTKANSSGAASWTFKQAAGVTHGSNSTARLTITARRGSTKAGPVHKTYRIG